MVHFTYIRTCMYTKNTLEYYSAKTEEETPPFATTWVDLRAFGRKQSGGSQAQGRGMRRRPSKVQTSSREMAKFWGRMHSTTTVLSNTTAYG